MDGDPLVINAAEFDEWIEVAKQERQPQPTCSGLPGSLIKALDRVAGLSSVGQPTDQAVADARAAYAREYPSE